MENDDRAELTGQTIPEVAESKPRPIRIWALHCMFSKTGFPVLGSFGSRERAVVIIPAESWTKLCQDIPALAAMQFEVGERS